MRNEECKMVREGTSYAGGRVPLALPVSCIDENDGPNRMKDTGRDSGTREKSSLINPLAAISRRRFGT